MPTAAQAVNTSNPDHVIGSGTPQSCTSQAVVNAVAQGGIITFDCGPDPVTITLDATAKVFNDTGPEIVIDGGGTRHTQRGRCARILYMNTCDQAQVWTTSHCQNQDHPRLTVQNLTFVDGYQPGDERTRTAVAARSWCAAGASRSSTPASSTTSARLAAPTSEGRRCGCSASTTTSPVYVVNSTFGGAPSLRNVCSNGGGISSIGVSWTIINSLFSHNRATGNGANPPQGGHSGRRQRRRHLQRRQHDDAAGPGTRIEHNDANVHGSAIFFVSNNLTGHLIIQDSVLRANPSDQFETMPGSSIWATVRSRCPTR